MRRILLLLPACLLLASCTPFVRSTRSFPKSQVSSITSQRVSEQQATSQPATDSTPYAPHPVPPPYSVTLTVPFSPQAPFGNWDPAHEEACEEMSLILVHHYLTGTGLSREQAETELQALLAWEREHGYPEDVTVAELKEIAEEYYGHAGRIVEDPTVDDLKRLLADGHPVIIPAAGRDLGNPFFSGEGPWYHMLVLTGYRPFFFVTNDVGTRRGEGYVYRYETLMNAIHDWTGVKEEIRMGPRRALVIQQ